MFNWSKEFVKKIDGLHMIHPQNTHLRPIHHGHGQSFIL